MSSSRLILIFHLWSFFIGLCVAINASPHDNHQGFNPYWPHLSGESDSIPLTTNNGPILNDAENVEHFDGFISYRRAPSKHFAMLIKVMLQQENVSAFLDVEDLEGGKWDVQLMQNIELSPNFILLLNNGTLDRCIGDVNYTDFLHKEIKEAVDLEKRIVPVFDDDFDWPSTELLSPEINAALANQGLFWEHRLVDQSLQRLISYMVMIAPKQDHNHIKSDGKKKHG